jgi:predicted dehydrogenase
VQCYGPFVGGGLVQRFDEARYLPTGQVSFTRPLHDYYGSLIETGHFPVTGAENLHVLATVLACYASAEAHEPVPISTITNEESIPHG